MRRRVRDGVPSDDDDGEIPFLLSAQSNQHETRDERGFCRRTYMDHRSMIKLILRVVGLYALLKGYYQLELAITNPFWEAAIFMPIQTWKVRFWQEKPGAPKTFTMFPHNSFVVNMDRDVERLRHFYGVNRARNQTVQRFPASEWLAHPRKNLTLSKGQSDEMDKMLKQQKQWETEYPWIRYSSKRGDLGDAGCALSHIRLLQKWILSSKAADDVNYIFVFEDDAKLVEPLLSFKKLKAPADADVIFLMGTASKTVSVPFQNSKSDTNLTAVRVIEGYGMLGYVITLNGASKLLQLAKTHAKPIDVLLAGSPFLRVYLPMGTGPLVEHVPFDGNSTRRKRNESFFLNDHEND